jgi:hypothetical protein
VTEPAPEDDLGMGWITDADFVDGGTPEDPEGEVESYDGGGPDSFA